MSLEPFPSVPTGEFTVFRPFTASGLFAYRHMQAINLLHFPDLASGDMSQEQRKEALLQMVSLRRPLAAVVLFLGVVALEDFIRDLGIRLAAIEELTRYFPAIDKLRPKLVKNPQRSSRPDRDPATLSDWEEVNKLYKRVLGITPFNESDFPKLDDLAIIRHTVAHHAALIRPIDADRFKFWSMQANALINPPVAFVQTTSHYLYTVGRGFENAVRDRIFSLAIPNEAPDWTEHPSELLLTLIETFNWFGKVLGDEGESPPYETHDYEEQLRAANAANRERLTRLCLEELKMRYS